MRTSFRVAALIAGLGIVMIARAEVPEAVSAKVFEFEVLEEELKEPFGKLDSQYLERLALVKKQRQEAGDLEGMLATQKEIEAIEAGEGEKFSAEGPVPQELTAARNIYDTAKVQLIAKYNEERINLKRELVAAIRDIQTGLTQEGQFEEAVEVRNYADELVNEIAAAANEVATAPTITAPSQSSGGEVTFKMQVDGTSHMFLRGDVLWYDHTNGKAAPVGLHQGKFPTHINDQEWMPEWSNKVTSKHEAGLGLPTSGDAVTLSVNMIEGRGHAEILEQPGPNNDYTAKLALHDMNKEGKRFFGSRWMEFTLSW